MQPIKYLTYWFNFSQMRVQDVHFLKVWKVKVYMITWVLTKTQIQNVTFQEIESLLIASIFFSPLPFSTLFFSYIASKIKSVQALRAGEKIDFPKNRLIDSPEEKNRFKIDFSIFSIFP